MANNFYSQFAGCGEEFIKDSGQFSFDGFPENYQRTSHVDDCVWHMVVPQGDVIQFHIEAEIDCELEDQIIIHETTLFIHVL